MHYPLNINNNKKLTDSLLLFIFSLMSVFALLCSPVYASVDHSTPLKFQKLSVDDGLSQNNIYSIAQDDLGFLWFASQDGLNKFDGHEFTVYKNDIDNSHSLANNFVREVYFDSEKNLWVGTQRGLSKYNQITDSFQNYFNEKNNPNSLKDNTIWKIVEDNNKNIWISTSSGLHKYNVKNDNFERVNFKHLENNIKEIKSIFQDDKNNLWLGTYENGLFILNENHSFISSLKGENKWKLNISENNIFDIQKIDNEYWLATEKGIVRVSLNYKVIGPLLISNSTNHGDNQIRTIKQVDEDNVWLGSELGLFIYNLSTGYLSKKNLQPDSHNSGASDYIFSIYEDKSNSIWVGTKYNGLLKYNSISTLFNHKLSSQKSNKNRVVSFSELLNGDIWIATELKGFYCIKSGSTELTHINIPLKEQVRSLYSSSDDVLWILTTNDELFKYQIQIDELTQHSNWLESFMERNSLIDFTFLDDNLWFGATNSTLYKYSTKTKKIKSYKLPQSPFNISLHTIGVDDKKQIWVYSSENKLYKFDTYSEDFIEHQLTNHPFFNTNSLSQIEETDNHLWFVFPGQGVLSYNKNNKVYTEYNDKKQLNNNFVSGLVIDNFDKVWISTNKGISSIDIKSQKVTNYGPNQGVLDGDFFTISYLKSKKGEIFFGGVDGYNSFYPLDIKSDSEIILPPINNHLLVENKKLEIIPSIKNEYTTSSLNSNLFILNDVTLSYQQTPFTVEFVSPNSTFPSEVNYRYKLDGIDENWIYTTAKNRRATYTKIPHGRYTFNVESINNKNQAIKGSKPLSITILPPWWYSKLAYLIYSLIFANIIYYFYKQSKNKEKTNQKIKASEERLKLALWGSGDEMWDWNMVTNQMYRSNIWGILDLPKPQSSKNNKDSKTENTNIHPQDHPRVKLLLNEHKANQSEHYEAAYRVRNKDGDWIWVLDRGKIVERAHDGSPIRMTGTLKDISQIKQTEESLKLFAKCIENISDAVVVYDANFYIVDCNLSYERITGLSKTQSLGKPLEFKLYPDSFIHNLQKNLIHHGSWQNEIESLRPDGTSYLIDITLDIIRDENDKISHYVGVFSDITKRKETEAELRKLANSDTLTGLPNRSFFQANQSQLVAQDVEHALLVFDLDNFKKINDSIGHQVGDVLLCKVTERIATVGNIKDTCYRLGGDEFSLIIEGTNDIHKITNIANEILATIAEPYLIRNQEIALTCSIGIALFPDDGSNSHELLKNADTAMYHAKDKSGHTYQFFNDSMNKQAVKRLQIENLIRHGLKEDLFSVYYQPKIDIQSGVVKGMEALVRFEAGDRGIIRPDIFIPISEETGQIIEIGELVLRKACIATKAWIDNGIFDGRVAVNLSAVQFRQPNLVKIIRKVLEDTKLPAENLELEITEGTVMDSPKEAIETMLQIREMGISLSLDDFGTGYSSLAYLKKFPLNTLKIDKAFVDDIEHSEEGRNMVATIVTIAHNLGMKLVAEGVEHQSQLDYLRTLNCEQLQGYLYSKPLNEEDFGRYLISHIITQKSTPYSSYD